MAVGAVISGSAPTMQKANAGGDDVAQLQRQKEMLQKQLEALKSKPKNSQAEQDAAVKQIRQLERQITEIDQKIQSQSQNQQQNQNASETPAVSLEKAVFSKSNSPLAAAQEKQSALHNMRQDETQESSLGDNSKTTGKLLDVYA